MNQYAGAKVSLCSAVADDLVGKAALESLERDGMNTSNIVTLTGDNSTAQYIAINDIRKNLVMGMADMRIIEESSVHFERLWKPFIEHCKPSWLVIDANWSREAIKMWVNAGLASGASIAFEPVSSEKSARLFYMTWQEHLGGLIGSSSDSKLSARRWLPSQLVDMVTPNATELKAMLRYLRPEDAWSSLLARFDKDKLTAHLQKHAGGSIMHLDQEIVLGSLRLLSQVPCIITKLGANGVLLSEILQEDDSRLEDPKESKYLVFRKTSVRQSEDDSIILPESQPESSLAKIHAVYLRAFSTPAELPPGQIISVNGVGDTFLGVLVAALAKSGSRPVSDFIDTAQQASILTLRSSLSVSPAVRGILHC